MRRRTRRRLEELETVAQLELNNAFTLQEYVMRFGRLERRVAELEGAPSVRLRLPPERRWAFGSVGDPAPRDVAATLEEIAAAMEPRRVEGRTADEWMKLPHVFSAILGIGPCGFCLGPPHWPCHVDREYFTGSS